MPRLPARIVRVVILSLVLLAARLAPGQVFVEQVTPPSLVRGTTTVVRVVGSRLEGVSGLWTSLDAPLIQAVPLGPSQEGNASFQVTVAQDAPLGLYGLRVATASGLSNVHLFLLDDLVTTPELESTDATAGADAVQAIAWPVAVNGTCRGSDVDRFAIQVEAQARLTFEVVASRLGQDFDPLLTILDVQGRRVASRDNDVGLCFDPRFEHQFSKAGRYIVELRDARFRAPEFGSYVLRIGSFPAARVAFPATIRAAHTSRVQFPPSQLDPLEVAAQASTRESDFYYALKRAGDQASTWIPVSSSELPILVEQESNDTSATATQVAADAIWHGQLAKRGDQDWYAFDGQQGAQLDFVVQTRDLGSPADLELVWYDANAQELQRVDTEVLGEARAAFSPPATGRYLLQVRELARRGAPEYTYRMLVRTRRPTIELDSASDNLAIPLGSFQPLPLTLSRTDYDGPVELSLVGAPACMSLRADAIPAGVSEFDNAIHVGGTVPLGLYTVQVVATAPIGDGTVRVVARTRPLLDRLPAGRGPHGEPFELREDQRRLPPTLKQQIAVLVLPPAPFSFDLEDSVVTLPRYQQAEFVLQTTREAGFTAPISFVARGGTLEQLNLQLPRVRAQIPDASLDLPQVIGILRSGVNSELIRHRVTVTATADDHGRRVSLTRVFQLVLQVAFNPAPELERIEIPRGESRRIRLAARRLAPFDGEVVVHPSRVAGILLPESVTIPASQPCVELDLAVAPDASPGTYSIAWPADAKVDRFQESSAGGKLEVIVVEKPAAASSGGGS